jgi:hypothetical protein
LFHRCISDCPASIHYGERFQTLIYASLLCAQDGLSTINYLQFGEDV